jgi:hypothetical protein
VASGRGVLAGLRVLVARLRGSQNLVWTDESAFPNGIIISTTKRLNLTRYFWAQSCDQKLQRHAKIYNTTGSLVRFEKKFTLKNAQATYNVGVVFVNSEVVGLSTGSNPKLQRQHCKIFQHGEQPSGFSKQKCFLLLLKNALTYNNGGVEVVNSEVARLAPGLLKFLTTAFLIWIKLAIIGQVPKAHS